AIIDWELATVGDPYMDVALMLMFWGEYRTQQPPAFTALQSVSRRSGVISRRELAGRWAEAVGRPLHHMNFYMALAFWRLAAIIEGAHGLYLAGQLDTDYARGLEYDVPALLAEAERAAGGDW
ncbi:phosphotransferase family protein, partial [Luminiphilus sp.]|nr:phosphotransferase family protein [Luminiphilus sp.]